MSSAAGRGERAFVGFDHQEGLRERPHPVLHVLPERVEVGRVLDGDRKHARPVLALALAVELLPPLPDAPQARLEDGEQVGRLADVEEGAAHARVLDGDVVVLGFELVAHLGGPGEERADVVPGGGDGQQPDGREHREAPADIVGDDERLVAARVGEAAEGALARIGRGDDAARGLGLAVRLAHPPFDEAKGERRFERRARLGDDVDEDGFALQVREELLVVGAAHVVPGKDDLRSAFRTGAVRLAEVRPERVEHGLRAEERPADADADEHIGLLVDARGDGLDAGKLLLVGREEQAAPPERIAARAGPVEHGAVRGDGRRTQHIERVGGEEGEGGLGVEADHRGGSGKEERQDRDAARVGADAGEVVARR